MRDSKINRDRRDASFEKSKKKLGEKKVPKIDRPDRYNGPERRKAPRQMHIIDDDSSDRDLALAKSDLENFFLDVLDKHHGF